MEILPNPWTEASAYDRFTLAGVEFVGKIELNADELLKKKSDHRRARGRNGGRSLSTGWDLVEFPVTLTATAYGPNGEPSPTFDQLQEILRRVGRGAVATQDTRAHGVSHPYLAAVDITQVTVEAVGFGAMQAGGPLSLKLKLKEWRAPTQAPGARAPTAAAQGREAPTVARDAQGRPIEFGPPSATLRPMGPPQPMAPNAPRPPSSDP